jgi:hypothetical protein
MSAYGADTDAAKTVLANAWKGAYLYFSLLQAPILQSSTVVGASTFSLDISVQAGDKVVFDVGLATEEMVVVQSVSGAGPYTVTPVTPLAKAHSTTTRNGMQSHVPLNSTTVHEIAGLTRVAASWGSATVDPLGVGGPTTVTSAASALTVPATRKYGSVSLHTASTSGTYGGAAAVPPQDTGAGGTSYQPLWVESFA